MTEDERLVCVSLTEVAKRRPLVKSEYQYILLLILSDGRNHKLNVLYLCLEGIGRGSLRAEDVVLSHHGAPTTSGRHGPLS